MQRMKLRKENRGEVMDDGNALGFFSKKKRAKVGGFYNRVESMLSKEKRQLYQFSIEEKMEV